MKNGNVLISGASIAGPALAYWLHRYGFRPTVVERAPAPRPGGHAVDLRGVARVVVERMGIMDEIRRMTIEERGLAYVNGAGRRVATMPAELLGGESVVAEIEILRSDLSGILHRATARDTEYLFGDRVTGLEQDDRGVKITFERAAPRAFDLVIGADGTRSGVRALAFGGESQYVRPLGGYTAVFTTPARPDLDGWFLMYNAPGRRVAALRPDRDPGSAKGMLSFASPTLSYDRGDTGQQLALLADRFAGMGWQVPWLLDKMREAPDFYFDAICQVHMPAWSSGRVALVGDAGYSPSPLTGLGTSLALVGAHVLAGELARTPDDHRGAFARYEDEMRGYVTESQKLPPGGIRGFAPKSALAIRARNASMRMMTVPPIGRLIAKQAAKASAIALKEYPG
jgi:2-polyprenyl-6-methoxyphenol hydroxylase-like FAD-dependent oxidoreductase